MPDPSASDFLSLLERLTAAGVDFAVVGGTAAVLYGASTATYDLDIVMPFSRLNCERLLTAVAPLRPRLSHTPDKRPLALSAEELVSFRNLYLTTDLGRLDVLGALPPAGTADQVLARAELMEVGAVAPIRVVALDMLIAVKAAMGRPKDKHVEMELRALAAARGS